MSGLPRRPRVVVAPDKFRGTATAREAAQAIGKGVERAGGTPVAVPMADGGEGTVDAFGGANRSTTVTGPLGTPVSAAWRLHDGIAVIEMAAASGLGIAGGATANHPLSATTRGTGELVAAAISQGAREIFVGLGGSATTDGGRGAVEALLPFLDPATNTLPARITCCYDVTTPFLDAAVAFAPQKGATPDQVATLADRLSQTAIEWSRLTGRDVTNLPGSGAAGGLGGGLAALGAELRPGAETIADHLGLDTALAGADLLITGEGRLDAGSLSGKVVSSVLARAAAHGVPGIVIAGAVDIGVELPARVLNLTARYGPVRALHDTSDCLSRAANLGLRSLGRGCAGDH